MGNRGTLAILFTLALAACGPSRNRAAGGGAGGAGVGAGGGGANGVPGGGDRQAPGPGDQQDDPDDDQAPIFEGEGEADPEPDPVPDPDPVPGVELPCEGPFVITSREVDEAPFPTHFVNPMLASDIDAGEMQVTLELLQHDAEAGGPALKWTDNIEGVDGAWEADGRVPESAAMPVEVQGRLIQTVGDGGHVGVWVSNSEYAGAGPIAWSQVDASITGVFLPDCTMFSGRLTGAFLDGPDYSIPAPADYDTDGDGTNDAYWLESEIRAAPWGQIQ